MTSTGIIRKIDDIGRVSIPKELRKTLKLNTGDHMEVFTNSNGEIILKKYAPMDKLVEYSKEYITSFGKTVGFALVVTSRDKILVSANTDEDFYKDMEISDSLDKLLKENKSLTLSDDEIIPLHRFDRNVYNQQLIKPIINSSNDVVGSIYMLNTDSSKQISVLEENLLEIATDFLGRQI